MLNKLAEDINAAVLNKLHKLAAKSGISNPMGGAPTASAPKPVKTAPVMSTPPINDMMPKVTTAVTSGMTLPTQTAANMSSASQAGVANNAVMPTSMWSGNKIGSLIDILSRL